MRSLPAETVITQGKIPPGWRFGKLSQGWRIFEPHKSAKEVAGDALIPNPNRERRYGKVRSLVLLPQFGFTRSPSIHENACRRPSWPSGLKCFVQILYLKFKYPKQLPPEPNPDRRDGGSESPHRDGKSSSHTNPLKKSRPRHSP